MGEKGNADGRRLVAGGPAWRKGKRESKKIVICHKIKEKLRKYNLIQKIFWIKSQRQFGL